MTQPVRLWRHSPPQPSVKGVQCCAPYLSICWNFIIPGGELSVVLHISRPKNWVLLCCTEEQRKGPLPKIWCFYLDWWYLVTWDSSYVSRPISESRTKDLLHQPKLFLYYNITKGTVAAYDKLLLAMRIKTPCLYVLLDICACSWSIYLNAQDDSWLLNVSKYGLCCQSSIVKCFSVMGTHWDLKCSWVAWSEKKALFVFSVSSSNCLLSPMQFSK